MNIHEYQAKTLLKRFNIPVLHGYPVLSAQDIDKAVDQLDGPIWVVKSQIHAGGRGAGKFKETNAGSKGGVRVCHSSAQAKEDAHAMLGKTLVTKQTGSSGKVVQRLYVEDGSTIASEFYLSALLDRQRSAIVIVASAQGGMDIEEVAERDPDAITKVWVDLGVGMSSYIARDVAFGLGLKDKNHIKQVQAVVTQLYHAVIGLDASLVEINPLVLTEQGDIIALDAKITIDDNALFRHHDLEQLRDTTEEDPNEREASDAGLNYIQLDGNIGCLVNGAGLAMATMDAVKMHGGTPANFLDVGGGATKEQVAMGFAIILRSASVKAILVNIFGGIMRCDIIAQGILAALEETKLTIPLVVRLEGTNVDKGKEILRKSGTNITIGDNLTDAAQKAVSLAG